MPITTGRTDACAEIFIDRDLCDSCGLCVKVCEGAPLYMGSNGVEIDQSRVFGCMGCGQCMAVCPKDCIEIKGRDITPKDLAPLPAPEARADYEHVLALLKSRRSIRKFREKPVEPHLLDKILEAASFAPMGIPPSDVEILVLNGRDKVRRFADDIVELMHKKRWLFSEPGLFFLRPLFGKKGVELARSFVRPLVKVLYESRQKGIDRLFYDAPLLLYFHCSPYADPHDPIITATYAMLTAQSLGLGSCMIGSPSHFIQRSAEFKKRYGIPMDNQQGIALILGYPRVKYRKAIKRRFAKVSEPG